MTLTKREERGLIIAATQKLTPKGKVWLVPSQSGNGKYTVCPDEEQPFCNCPDFAEWGHECPCKHVIAVRITLRREQSADGTVTETKSITLTEKKVYKQPPGYLAAQTNEKRHFKTLLADLCQTIQEPPLKKRGRNRIPLRDCAFGCTYKVYSTISSRRFNCDLQDAHKEGLLTRPISWSRINAMMEADGLSPVLKELIVRSAAPLKAVETDFALDSTGFSTSRHVKWFDEKYGAERSGRDWVKVHIATGVRTNIVTAVEIKGREANDAPLFGPLVKTTAANFAMKEISGDKAYLSQENIETAFSVGATPFIPFKVNSTGAAGGLFEKMFHYFSLNREEYMTHYHKRSNVESTFSAIKRVFGDNVRSRTDAAMVNEALCKILAHNLRCVIHAMYELGIDPTFVAA